MGGIAEATTIDPGPDGRAQAGSGAAPDSRQAPFRRAGGEALAAAPTALVAILLLVAGGSNGAYALRSWGALAVFGLVALAVARPVRTSRPALTMVAAAWGYAAWSAASVAWAQVPGDAIEGGARNVMYAMLVSLPVLTLPSRRSCVWLGHALTAGLALLTAGTLVALHRSGMAHFLAGRLDDPVGYRNGTAALFALAYWPLVSVAGRRSAHVLLRAACFALALAALGLAFLTQSRGVILGFTAGGVVALVLGPDRLRRAWLTILVLGALALRAHVLLTPYDAFLASSTTSAAAVAVAVRALTVLTLIGFGVGLGMALLDGGLRVSGRVARSARLLAAGGLAVLAVSALAGGLSAVGGNPVAFVRGKAHEFTQLDTAAGGETRLGSTSGQRYDLWRIAWNEFRSAPIGGVGESSYEPGYYAQRRTDRNLTTPHSLVFSALAETGIVGALLLAAMLGSAAVALARGWRETGPDERRLASALAAAGAVVLAQSVVDWLWLIPGLAGLGLLCLAAAVAIVARPDGALPSRSRAWLPLRVLPVLGALLTICLVVSNLYVRTARAETAAPPAQRLELARTAARLDPFATTPLYLEAGALEEQGRRTAARARLRAALQREPRSFVTMALLGDLETRAGHPRLARQWYRRALAANPGDTGLQQLAR